MPIAIALDAMGSDKAPKPEVEGAILAARHYDVEVFLVGNEPAIRAELANHRTSEFSINIVHASEVVTMHEKVAQAVRSKRDSSMRVGLRLVRDGKAQGFVSAGNTGAAMATAKMVLGVLTGRRWPACFLRAPVPPR
jgi:glycerol-3-phosphate acyltransferase PlsX